MMLIFFRVAFVLQVSVGHDSIREISSERRLDVADTFSDYFCVPTGVKQGGVISSSIFTVYNDDLLKQ